MAHSTAEGLLCPAHHYSSCK